MSDDQTPQWQRSFLRALLLIGVNPKETDEHGEPNLRYDYVDRDARVSIALVRQQIAIAFTNDEYETLENEGWAIVKFSVRDLEAFSNVMSGIFDVQRELHKSQMTTPKQTSRAEELLINTLLSDKYELPMPQRDYAFRDDETGREVTTPDMAWPKYKLCVYVDGGWWHHGKDIVEQLQMDDKEKRQIADRVTRRNEKDANNRRFIEVKLGWKTIVCSAERLLESKDYLTEIADDIKRVYMREYKTQESQRKYGTVDSSSVDDII